MALPWILREVSVIRTNAAALPYCFSLEESKGEFASVDECGGFQICYLNELFSKWAFN